MENAFIEFCRRLILLVITPNCYDVFFTEFNFFHVECVKSSVSKLLGFGIIAGSVLVKVPQIMKIIRSKSGAGISIIAQLLELYGVIAYVAYSYVKGFPFSSWGEGVFMIIQTSLIIKLVMFFNGQLLSALLFVCSSSCSIYVLTSGFVPVTVLWFMQASSVPIMFIGKSIQAYSNYTSKNMGQQSIVTCLLMFAGSLARILTSVQETGDPILIITYLLASTANGLIFSQFFIYKSKTIPEKPSRKKRN